MHFRGLGSSTVNTLVVSLTTHTCSIAVVVANSRKILHDLLNECFVCTCTLIATNEGDNKVKNQLTGEYGPVPNTTCNSIVYISLKKGTLKVADSFTLQHMYNYCCV